MSSILAAFGLAAAVGAASAGAAQTAYFRSFDSGSITRATVAANGAVTLAQGSTTASITPIGGLAVAPGGRQLFTATAGNSLLDFAIAPSGSLSFADSVDVNGDNEAHGIVTTPNGRFIYSAGLNYVNGAQVNAGGGLDALPDSTDSTTPNALAMAPDGKHFYSAGGYGQLVTYTINPDGTTEAGPADSVGHNGDSASITPDGKALYVANDNLPSDLYKFQIGANGELTQLGDPAELGGQGSAGMAMTPDAKYLYVGNSQDGVVYGFRIGAGAPVPLSGSPFSATGLSSPAAMAITAAGNRLLVTDGGSTDVSVFAIAADGDLAPIAGSPFDTGQTGDFQSVVLTPDQPPRASFTTIVNGRRVTFDGTGTTDPDGAVARYDWDFGDGATLPDGGPQVTHKYKPGAKPAVTLTATDAEGCSTRYIATGQTPLCNGSALARSVLVPFQATLPAGGSQKLGRKVRLKVACPLACKAKASGSLKLSGGRAKAAKLKGAKAQIAAGKTAKLKLKLSKGGFRSARSANKAVAKIKVTAADSRGDVFKKKIQIKLR